MEKAARRRGVEEENIGGICGEYVCTGSKMDAVAFWSSC